MISPQASIPRLLTSTTHKLLSINISKISGRIDISIMYHAARWTRQCSIA